MKPLSPSAFLCLIYLDKFGILIGVGGRHPFVGDIGLDANLCLFRIAPVDRLIGLFLSIPFVCCIFSGSEKGGDIL